VIDSSENLSSDSVQFVANLVRQRKYESGVDFRKWNILPLILVKRLKSCLSGLGFEIHDDVLGDGVPLLDLEYGNESVEIVLGEPGIDCEPYLSPLPFWRDDSAFRRV
jgi:hypothetical protein